MIIHIYNFFGVIAVWYLVATTELEKHFTTPAQVIMHNASTSLDISSTASERGGEFTLLCLQTRAV